jgi:hypothetical protein
MVSEKKSMAQTTRMVRTAISMKLTGLGGGCFNPSLIMTAQAGRMERLIEYKNLDREIIFL